MLEEKKNTNLIFVFTCGHKARQCQRHITPEPYDESKPNRYLEFNYKCIPCRDRRSAIRINENIDKRKELTEKELKRRQKQKEKKFAEKHYNELYYARGKTVEEKLKNIKARKLAEKKPYKMKKSTPYTTLKGNIIP